MRIFLSARYGRREEMLRRAKELEGETTTFPGRSEIVSLWIYSHGEATSTELAEESMPKEAKAFAIDDLEDLDRAQVFIAFTEKPNNPFGRGGRHVEFGYAFRRLIESNLDTIIIVGPEENIFHALPTFIGSGRLYHVKQWNQEKIFEFLRHRGTHVRHQADGIRGL